MKRTLYVTDLDGTLLNQAGRIPPESLEILNRLMARGMLFTYATARSYVSASVVTDGLRVSAPGSGRIRRMATAAGATVATGNSLAMSARYEA